MKYLFAKNINGSEDAGIIEVDSMEVICLCTETKSKLLLQALNMSGVVKSSPDKYCSKCGEPIDRPHKFWCGEKAQ